MKRVGSVAFTFVPQDEQDELPALDPFLVCEVNDRGWRGLSATGEVVNVEANPGEPRAVVPHGFVVVFDRAGQRIGKRAMPAKRSEAGRIQTYLDRFNLAVQLLKRNELAPALANIEQAIGIATTSRARFNRSLILLAMGRWEEGFADHEARLELMNPPMCDEVELLGVPRWNGDYLEDRLLLVHDAGFGDAIMMLRYVPMLMRKNGGNGVMLKLPPELKRLGEQLAPVVDDTDAADADYFCPLLSLLSVFGMKGVVEPYLTPLEYDVERYRARIGADSVARRIGIVWSVGRNVIGDYPRPISAALLVKTLRERHRGCELYSLQKQDEALAASLGVETPPMNDIADCAALMALMDEIVTVDTAALHVAGAIGHPKITALLSYWASWRWREDLPLYPNVRLCRQDAPGDWVSALAKMA